MYSTALNVKGPGPFVLLQVMQFIRPLGAVTFSLAATPLRRLQHLVVDHLTGLNHVLHDMFVHAAAVVALIFGPVAVKNA